MPGRKLTWINTAQSTCSDIAISAEPIPLHRPLPSPRMGDSFLLVHQSVHIFTDDYRIIHHNTDSEDKTESGVC